MIIVGWALLGKRLICYVSVFQPTFCLNDTSLAHDSATCKDGKFQRGS